VGTETLLQRIYVSQKYPHIYMLSISTGKNQSTKVRGALYILIFEYNYKIITGCDTMLQEYGIIDRRKYENTKRYTSMNSTKGTHELQKKLESQARVSRPASQNTLKRRCDESRRRIYVRKIPHVTR